MLQSLKNKGKLLGLVGLIFAATSITSIGCIPRHMTYKDEAWKYAVEEQKQMNYKRRNSQAPIPQRTSDPNYLGMSHDSLISGSQEIQINTGRTR
ncbi:MAG: hypothetical protein V1815_01105 [Candidatus Woesearchaeota archaeon]